GARGPAEATTVSVGEAGENAVHAQAGHTRDRGCQDRYFRAPKVARIPIPRPRPWAIRFRNGVAKGSNADFTALVPGGGVTPSDPHYVYSHVIAAADALRLCWNPVEPRKSSLRRYWL